MIQLLKKVNENSKGYGIKEFATPEYSFDIAGKIKNPIPKGSFLLKSYYNSDTGTNENLIIPKSNPGSFNQFFNGRRYTTYDQNADLNRAETQGCRSPKLNRRRYAIGKHGVNLRV